MTDNEKMHLRKVLTLVNARVESTERYEILSEGICKLCKNASLMIGYDSCETYAISKWLVELMNKWPERSGEMLFPVPGPHGMVPAHAFYMARTCPVSSGIGHLWDANTEYGQARRRLLEWLIEEVRG